jgi:hypothetical protein
MTSRTLRAGTLIVLVPLLALSCASRRAVRLEATQYESCERLESSLIRPLDRMGSDVKSRYSIRHVTCEGRDVVLLVELVKEGENQFRSDVWAELEVPPLQPGQTLVLGVGALCERDGLGDSSIIAILTDSHGEYDSSPVRAWRADSDKKCFEEIPTEGLRCRNRRMIR